MIVCLCRNFPAQLCMYKQYHFEMSSTKGDQTKTPEDDPSYCIFPLTGHRTELDPVLSVREIRAEKVKGRS